MIDISVKDLVKSFDEDENLLDGISFDVQSGERVGLLGKNGAGKTTLFKILTGEMDYNSGEIAFAQGKKVGLISQIPVYPAEFTVNDVLRAAFSSLDKIKARMRQLEKTMTEHTPKEILSEYDALTSRFEAGGGYEIDTETDKICNGLMISQTQREQLFSSLSGGEKTRVNLARLLLEKTDILLLPVLLRVPHVVQNRLRFAALADGKHDIVFVRVRALLRLLKDHVVVKMHVAEGHKAADRHALDDIRADNIGKALAGCKEFAFPARAQQLAEAADKLV